MSGIDRLPPVPGIKPPFEPDLIRGDRKEQASFGETLKEFVGDVNEMQLKAGDKIMKFATGEIKDLHEVMAASEEAGISLMLLMEIRNKLMDAYKELMRTPV